jgi:VWFA-related protein
VRSRKGTIATTRRREGAKARISPQGARVTIATTRDRYLASKPSLRTLAVFAFFAGFAIVSAASQGAPAQPGSNTPSVKIDVHATTDDGQPVTDLTAADFEVREDNVPQQVESAERVELSGTRAAVPGSGALAPGERTRIVAIFLDTYHTDPAAIRMVAPSLERLLETLLDPADVIAVMTPEMSSRDVTFARKAEGVAAALAPVREWASRDRTRLRDLDEQRYTLCFPDQDAPACPDVVGPNQSGPLRAFAPYRGAAREMAERRHGQRTVQALEDLSRTLQAENDGRKAVLLLSGGWPLFRENLALARMVRCAAPAERTTRDRDEDEGRPRDRDRIADIADQTICDADRRRLAALDLQAEFRRMLDVANSALVSVYPFDPGGVEPSPSRRAAGPGRAGRPGEVAGPSADTAETLKTLGEQTGGQPMAHLNDGDGGLGRAVRALSSYYLVAYRSSSTRTDGVFRRVDVSSIRRGVAVHARRGYRAATLRELERQRTQAALAGQTAVGTLGGVAAAIAALADVPRVAAVRTRVAYGPVGGGRVHVWAATEIDTATSRAGAWLGGGTVDASLTLADNRAVASTEAALPGGRRAVLLDLGEIEAPPTASALRVRLRPFGDGPALTDDVALAPLAASGPGVPLVLRRGATTGMRYQPTADLRFQRTERLRLEFPRASAPRELKAELLDRMGSHLAVNVVTSTRVEGSVTWAVVEVSLAPLAHGDYAVRVTFDGAEAVTGVRVIP